MKEGRCKTGWIRIRWTPVACWPNLNPTIETPLTMKPQRIRNDTNLQWDISYQLPGYHRTHQGSLFKALEKTNPVTENMITIFVLTHNYFLFFYLALPRQHSVQ
ncbi:hypothetical protein V1478_003590 [Vespula squamosa]|uniref:Uncharacterized protein n=1 Tax=Vespula squamosa TaxID=30214 RepID=A0ABD2BM89_VESSQ